MFISHIVWVYVCVSPQCYCVICYEHNNYMHVAQISNFGEILTNYFTSHKYWCMKKFLVIVQELVMLQLQTSCRFEMQNFILADELLNLALNFVVEIYALSKFSSSSEL